MSDLRSISYGETKSGFIDSGDPKLPNLAQFYYEPVTFVGTKGNEITLTITSDLFDPVVWLVTPSGSRDEFLANPVTGPPYEKTRTVTLEETGEYTFWISHSDYTRRGPYEITLTADVGDAAFEVSPSAPTASDTLTFDASPTTGAVESYEWAFGDGTTTTGEAVTHSYDAAGTYTAELTVNRRTKTQTATKSLDIARQDDSGDAGITAQFDYTPQFATPASELVFDGSPSTGDVTAYRWSFGDGTTATGTQVTHSYDDPGEYAVELRAQGSTDGTEVIDSTSATVQIDSADDPLVTGFTASDTEPWTNESVRFDTGVDAETAEQKNLSLVWAFGDGTTTKGATVSHQYTGAGTYTVTLTTADNTFTKELTVNAPPVEITGLDRTIGGTLLPQLGIQEDVEATVDVAADRELDHVEFEFNGQRDSAASAPYDASLVVDDVSAPDTPLIVRAVTTDGATRERTVDIPVQQLPEWLEFLLTAADSLGVEQTDDELQITYNPLSNLSVGFDVPKELLGGDDTPTTGSSGGYDFGVDFGGVYNPLTNQAELTAAGAIGGEVLAVAFEVDAKLTGRIEPSALALQRAQADIDSQLEFDIEPPLVPVPISIPIPGTNSSVGIVPTIVVTADGTFDFNGDLSFDAGTIKPGIALEVSIGIELAIPGLPDGELKGVPSGGIEGSVDVGTADWNLQATFVLAGKVVLDPPIIPPITIEQDPIWEQPLTENTSQNTAHADSEPAVRHSTAGGTQPLPEIDSVDTVGARPDNISPKESFRLTDRPYEDVEPALASVSDSRQLAVWGQQAETKPAEAGHDLVGRWYDNGSWSEPFSITDDTYAHADPVCAATDSGEVLIAWKRLTTDLTTTQIRTVADVDSTRDQTEIAYSIYDGSSWSEPTTLTDTSVVQRRPTVAAADGGWQLAWESFDRETDTSTVRSAGFSPDGTATQISDRSGAASPDLGQRTDGQVDLAYLVFDGTQVTDVAHEVRDGTTVVSERSYAASGAAAVAVSNGRIVWTVNANRNPTLIEGTNGTTTELTLRADVAEVRELSLSARSGKAILSYVSTLDGSSTRELVYRLDRGNGWIYDRSITEDISDGLRVRYTDLEFVGSASFMSAYSVRDVGTESVSDVFATVQTFGPAYAISASVADAAAGEKAMLSYQVTNRGDVGGTESISVTIRRDGTETDTVTHNPLDSSGTLTRDRTVTVGDGGTFELELSVSEPSLETAPRQVKLVAARPQLRVDGIEAHRTGTNTATVAVTVANDGGAAAQSVPVELRDASGTVATVTADRVGPAATTTVEATVDPTGLDTSDTHEVRLDPGDTLPARAETAGLQRTYLVRPSLRVKDVRYREDNGRFARVLVSNDGPGAGTATLAIYDDTGTELATTELSVPPAQTENGQRVSTHRTVDIAVPALETGQTVAVEIEPTLSNLRQEALTTVETVETVLPGDYGGSVGDVALTANGGTAPVGGNTTINLTAENITQVTLENLWSDWTVSADVPAEVIDDTVAENGSVTLQWQETQLAASPALSVSVPDRYVGGTYLVDVTVTRGDQTAEATVTITVE